MVYVCHPLKQVISVGTTVTPSNGEMPALTSMLPTIPARLGVKLLVHSIFFTFAISVM